MSKSLLLFFVALFIGSTLLSQEIKPSYQDMGGIYSGNSSSSDFRVRFFYEVLTLHSLSAGLGAKFYTNARYTFETSFHYDVIRNVSLAKSGFQFYLSPFHFGVEYSYINNFRHGFSYMPVYIGIGDRRKWSLCYVRNCFLESGNEFNYPLNQISFKHTIKFKKRYRRKSDKIIEYRL